MIFKQIRVGDMENFSYIVGDENEVAIVDIGWEPDKIIDICSRDNLNITKVLLTHTHFDHVQALDEFLEKVEADVYVHEKENYDFGFTKVQYVKEGNSIMIGEVEVRVIETPGHTPGGVCYLVNNQKLLSGDTLFVGAIGRTDLPGSDPQQMKKSLARLKELDDSIEVYSGHDYGETPSSTIGQEKKENPYLR